MKLADKLVEIGNEWSNDLIVKDVRLGLGYSCAELSDNSMGLAWTPSAPKGSCTHVDSAGKIAGSLAKDILFWLKDEDAIKRAVGLAVFNALSSKRINKAEVCTKETVSSLNLTEDDHVAMVGFFGPVIPRIKKTGCKLSIIELDDKKPGVISAEDGKKVLKECSVAIITATTIINGTCDDVIASLGNPRVALMLGPSTPLCLEAFSDTPINQLSGSLVNDSEKIKQLISEGGGTRYLKSALDFVSLVK